MSLADRFVLKALDRLSIGCLTMRLTDGSTRTFGTPGASPQAEIEITDRRFFRKVDRKSTRLNSSH